ncbi:MAG TPA: hypothetical protein VMX97_15195 [Hyphomicrobiaceae bacterium]|nr:hypothetical protein [Hyphomicrobiaceae bacterium]
MHPTAPQQGKGKSGFAAKLLAALFLVLAGGLLIGSLQKAQAARSLAHAHASQTASGLAAMSTTARAALY